MASLDPVLDLLPRAPLAGLDVNAVQRERKNYWERLYEKVLSEQDQSADASFQYEQSSELDQEEIPVDELDDPATLKRLPVLLSSQHFSTQSSITRVFSASCQLQGLLEDILNNREVSLTNVSISIAHRVNYHSYA